MSDIHIEEFYHDIGLILSRLYASFPRPSTIYVEDIAGVDIPDEYGIHSDRFFSCFSAMLWLQKQRYLHFESTIRQEAIDQAVLTEKSFLVLSSQSSIAIEDTPDITDMPPYAARNAITHISLLRQALKSQSSIQISEIVFHIMEQSHSQ